MRSTKILLSLFFGGTIVITVAAFIGIWNKKAGPHYGDLDTLISMRYGSDYEFVVMPPLPMQTGNLFILSEHDLVFRSNESIEGILRIRDDNFTYSFPFSHEADPDNCTVVCAVRGLSPNGWAKVVLKVKMSQECKCSTKQLLAEGRFLTARYSVKDSSGTQTLEYDELDRNTQTVFEFTGLEVPVALINTFDEMNRRTKSAVKLGEVIDTVTGYAYNALGQMIGIAQNDKRIDYTYNAAGQRTATSVYSGANKVFDTLYGYDGVGRLTDLTHANGEKVFADYDYSWDIANRITDFDFTYLGEKESKTAEYGYDNTSQLVSAGYNAFQSNESYEYDANGNRKNFDTGKNNQLTSDGGFRYTYDDEGNRVSKVSKNSKTEYFWDHRNRLAKVVDNGKSVEYDYDYQNRLVRRNDELFVHDGWQIACSLKNGKIGHRYLWGSVQDELLAMDDNWALRDHLNTVRKVMNAKGKVVSDLDYNAFGALINATGERPLFRYTGKLFDDATALQWNINRWYDAEVGRWISEDPIGFEGGDYNVYRYVLGMPVTYTDAHGHHHISDEDVKIECDRLLMNSPNSLGLVLCYRGEQFPCVNDTRIDDTIGHLHPIGVQAIKDCTKAHEEAHIDEGHVVDCGPCNFGAGGGVPENKDSNECAALVAEYACLWDNMDRCDDEADATKRIDCKAVIQAAAEFTLSEAKATCAKVGIHI
jgi:RHS repeat-associated protein